MKRIKENLWLAGLLLCSLLSLGSCSDSDDDKKNPSLDLESIVLPESDESHPLASGTEVKITGKGLSCISSIYLEAESAVKPNGQITLVNCLETEIKTLDDTQAVILLPEGLNGYYNVIFVVGTDKWRKEKIFIATLSPLSLSRIVVLAETPSTGAIFYEWSMMERKFCEKCTVAATPIEAALGGNSQYAYFFGLEKQKDDNASLFRVDLENGSSRKINTGWLADTDSEHGATGQAIGLINDKLYGVKRTNDGYFQVVRIEDDGKETSVQDFAPVAGLEDDFNCDDDNLFFTYDALNQTILLTGWANEAAVVALNMETNTVGIFQEKDVNRYACIKVEDEIWLIGNKQVRKLDSTTMTTSPTGIPYNSNWAYYAVYNKADQCIYWVESNRQVSDEVDELHYYNTKTKAEGVVGTMEHEFYCPLIAVY